MLVMQGKHILTIAVVTAVLGIVGGRADSALDRYTVQVPNGLALSAFRGYESWQVVAVSQTQDTTQDNVD